MSKLATLSIEEMVNFREAFARQAKRKCYDDREFDV
jgi:hypothetical protein